MTNCDCEATDALQAASKVASGSDKSFGVNLLQGRPDPHDAFFLSRNDNTPSMGQSTRSKHQLVECGLREDTSDLLLGSSLIEVVLSGLVVVVYESLDFLRV